MNHEKRKNSYKRATRAIKPQRRFILYVEGHNTEKSYFDLLKKSNCQVTPVTKPGSGIGSCEDFVNESEKAWQSLPREEKNKYAKAWLVFDADGRGDFSKAITLARQKKFGVAFSNMCIEYWFLLHFEDHSGNPIPMIGGSHSAAQIKMINSYIQQYNQKTHHQIKSYNSSSKKVEEDFFYLLMAKDPVSKKERIVLAFERAKAIHDAKKKRGNETGESVTTIYELLHELGVIEKKKDEYVLFEK